MNFTDSGNTYGGVIICGVGERKDGTCFSTGMKDASKLKKNFWNQANDQRKVSVNLLRESDVNVHQVGEDVIMVINVPAATREHKPVFINGDMYKGTFKRNNEGDYHCTRDEVQAILRDQTRLTMDMKVLENLELSIFERESVKAYRTWFDNKHTGHAWSKLSTEEFLERIGAASDDTTDRRIHPTCAGLLMFGPEYKITREYPNFFLDFRSHMDPSVRWTDRLQSQSPDWSGNVFDFFTMVSAKLTRDIEKPFQLNGIVRVDETPIHTSVREALVNRLVNADYFLPRGVVIEKYPDKIVFRNPGTSIVGKRQMIRGGDSEPRNANIMKMLNLLGFGEHAGCGVPDIYEAWGKAKLKDPTIEECFGEGEPAKTIVTLPLLSEELPKDLHLGEEKGEEKGEESRVSIVLDLIKEDPKISMATISGKTGFTKRQVEKTIAMLKKNGTIHREGPAKGGEWVLNNSF